MRKSTSWLRFAYYLGFSLLVFTSAWYSQLSETPPWRQSSSQTPDHVSQPISSRASAPNHSSAFRFVSYNLKNWLTSSQNPEKSPESKNSIIEILTSCEADVIGLSEIGSEQDVLEVQKLLKNKGCDLPYFYHTGGSDPIRHLAILSRFPITSKIKPEISIDASDYSMQRGILDVTVRIANQPIRFIGLHLKSKRTVPGFDQAQIRIREAKHVRKYIDSILSDNPETRLIAYGDFNDHIQSLSTKTILGSYRSPHYLTPVQMNDQRGEKWTHYFKLQDSYSRIDFITVSKSLKPHIDQKNSRIIDTPNWSEASDHRAIMVGFR